MTPLTYCELFSLVCTKHLPKKDLAPVSNSQNPNINCRVESRGHPCQADVGLLTTKWPLYLVTLTEDIQ